MHFTVAWLAAIVGVASAGVDTEYAQWNGWGGSIANTRWARSSQVTPSSVQHTRVHCQLHYPQGESAAPTLDGDIAYYPTWSGVLVALDFKTCQVLWETNITQIVVDFAPPTAAQTAILHAVSRTSPFLHAGVLYLGTQMHALLLAVDAESGKVLGSKQIDDHPLAILTQSPTVYDGLVFIGTSSSEETASAFIPGYQCCSFVGSFSAFTFDTATGDFELAWTISMLPSPPGNWSGVAVWGSQPSIDESRSQVFIATGNVYTAPKKFEDCAEDIESGNATGSCLPRRVYQESVIAVDVVSGQINWIRRLGPLDAWTLACTPGAGVPGSEHNCPPNAGQDADFGMAPSFISASRCANTPGGQDTLVVGQKNGNLYALSADDGVVQWVTVTSPDGTGGGLNWGVAVDDTRIYYTAINYNQRPYVIGPDQKTIYSSAWGAANLTDGQILWETKVPGNISISQVPPTVAGGVVVTGRQSLNGTDPTYPVGGEMVMLDAGSGEVLNRMVLDAPGHGGTAADGKYLLFGSGYYYGAEGNGSFYVLKVAE